MRSLTIQILKRKQSFIQTISITFFVKCCPFRYLTSLKLLDLTNAFNERSSPRRRADLLRSLFESDHDFVDLNEIILASNHLEHIHKDTFCKVSQYKTYLLMFNY